MKARLDEDSPEPEPKLQQVGAPGGKAGGRGPTAVPLRSIKGSAGSGSKACATCGTHTTPMWRVVNSQTFCNA